MLYLIVLWTVIALASVRLSLLVLPVDVRDRTDGALKADTLFVHIWLGLAMTGGILTALAQVLPLRPEIGLVGLLVLMLDLIRGRIRRSITALIPRLSFKQASLALIPAVLVAFAAAQQVTYFDTAFYHLQLSRLLAEYGAIPGIVALHPNFGQSSLWFAMVAPTLIDGPNGWGATTFNGFVSALAAVQAAVALGRAVRGRAALPDWIAAVGYTLVLACVLRWGMLASASPDLPVMIVTVTAAWMLARNPAGPRQSAGPATVVAAFAVAIKLSAAPLLAIAGLKLLWDCKGAIRPAVPFILLAGLCVAGLALLGERASGCFAYPISFTCLDRAWTPDTAALTYHTDLIASAARGGGRPLSPDTAALAAVKTWLTRDKSGAVLVGGAVLLGLLFLFYGAVRRAAVPSTQRWIAAMAAIGTLFVLATAPTGRFVAGFTAVWLGLWASQLASRLDGRPMPLPRIAAAGIAALVGLVASIATAPHVSLRGTVADRVAAEIYPNPGLGLIYPKRLINFDIHHPDLPRLSEVQTVWNGFVTVNKPVSSGECWAAAPPCNPSTLSNSVRYLDPDLGPYGGFYKVDPGAPSGPSGTAGADKQRNDNR